MKRIYLLLFYFVIHQIQICKKQSLSSRSTRWRSFAAPEKRELPKNRSDPSGFLTKSEKLFQPRPRIRMKQTNKYKNIACDSAGPPNVIPPLFAVAQQRNIRTRPLLFSRGPVRDSSSTLCLYTLQSGGRSAQ